VASMWWQRVVVPAKSTCIFQTKHADCAPTTQQNMRTLSLVAAAAAAAAAAGPFNPPEALQMAYYRFVTSLLCSAR